VILLRARYKYNQDFLHSFAEVQRSQATAKRITNFWRSHTLHGWWWGVLWWALFGWVFRVKTSWTCWPWN